MIIFPCDLKSLFCFAAGIVIEDKNWPPFFPIIHHNIANEIPIHLQRLQYFAFATLLGIYLLYFVNVVGIFYLVFEALSFSLSC